MQFTYEYCHSGVAVVMLTRIMFNLVNFLSHFQFWKFKHIFNQTILNANCLFSGLTTSCTPGCKGLITSTYFTRLDGCQEQEGA